MNGELSLQFNIDEDIHMTSKDYDKNDYGLNLDLKSSHPNNVLREVGAEFEVSILCPTYLTTLLSQQEILQGIT